jgi:hypothetical protein
MRVNEIQNILTPEGSQRMSGGTTAPTEETEESLVATIMFQWFNRVL